MWTNKTSIEEIFDSFDTKILRHRIARGYGFFVLAKEGVSPYVFSALKTYLDKNSDDCAVVAMFKDLAHARDQFCAVDTDRIEVMMFKTADAAEEFMREYIGIIDLYIGLIEAFPLCADNDIMPDFEYSQSKHIA